MINEPKTAVSPQRLDAAAVEARLSAFGALLADCVEAGANVNFVKPFSEAQAEAFWRDATLPALREGRRALWAVEEGGALMGAVQLDWATPPNQPHRAEVTKLLVAPSARRRGLARALMSALEAEAARLGRWLITLDTRTGSDAEPLYASLGYETAGVIPDFCVDPDGTRLWPTTLMFKRLPR